MRKVFFLMVSVVLVIAFLGCATTDQVTKTLNGMEGDAQKIQNNGGFAVVGMGQSKNLDMARQKAIAQSQQLLAEAMTVKVDGLKKVFSEEVGDEINEYFSNALKTITSQELRGARQIKSEILKIDGEYTYFAVMELSPEIVMKSLENEIQREKALYQRYQASKGFQELENEVNKYKEYERENAEMYSPE